LHRIYLYGSFELIKNYHTKIKQKLISEVDKALDVILKEHFGNIKIIVDENRKIYDVIPSPRIRVKS